MRMFAVLSLSCLIGVVQAQDIVPRPAQLQRGTGEYVLTPATRIVASGKALPEASTLRDYLRPATGFDLRVSAHDSANAIRLRLDPKADLGKEGYRLVSDAHGVTISAAQPAGLFYGVQTLRQLLPADIHRQAVVKRTWTLPAVAIEDAPRFSWRGSHLEVARPDGTTTYPEPVEPTVCFHRAVYQYLRSGNPAHLRQDFPDAIATLATVLACNRSHATELPVRVADVLEG